MRSVKDELISSSKKSWVIKAFEIVNINKITLFNIFSGIFILLSIAATHPITRSTRSKLENAISRHIVGRQKRFTVATMMNIKGGGFDNATHVKNFLSHQKTKEFMGSIIGGGIAGAPGGPAGVSLGAIAGAIGFGIGNIPTTNSTGM